MAEFLINHYPGLAFAEIRPLPELHASHIALKEAWNDVQVHYQDKIKIYTATRLRESSGTRAMRAFQTGHIMVSKEKYPFVMPALREHDAPQMRAVLNYATRSIKVTSAFLTRPVIEQKQMFYHELAHFMEPVVSNKAPQPYWSHRIKQCKWTFDSHTRRMEYKADDLIGHLGNTHAFADYLRAARHHNTRYYEEYPALERERLEITRFAVNTAARHGFAPRHAVRAEYKEELENLKSKLASCRKASRLQRTHPDDDDRIARQFRQTSQGEQGRPFYR